VRDAVTLVEVSSYRWDRCTIMHGCMSAVSRDNPIALLLRRPRPIRPEKGGVMISAL